MATNQTRVPTPTRSEAELILENLRCLRDQIVTAWRERAVILSADERAGLRKEIKETCEFLELLARDD